MRILWKKLKEGKVRVAVDTLEDFWHLSNLIGPGDTVHATSFRRVELKEKQRASRAEKKKVHIELRVDSVEFDRNANRLRIAGIIESGKPEEWIDFGSHHTINLELGDTIIIEKPWRAYQLKMLKDAERKRPKILILSIDKGDAVFGLVKDYGIEYAHLNEVIPGKDAEDREIESAESKFYTDVLNALDRYKFERCVICGAGFWKDEFWEHIQGKPIAKKCLLEHTGSGGENSISEVLKRGILHRLVAESKIAEEAELVEALLAEIGKSGNCTYGLQKVRGLPQGAVKSLLITDVLLRTENLDGFLKQVESAGGTINIISVEHESGKQLDALGGIAAITRYRVE